MGTTSVRLSVESLALARQAVEKGHCESIEEAVERALQVMAAADLELDQMFDAMSPEDVEAFVRMVEEGADDVRAGNVSVAGRHYWETVRGGAAADPITHSR
jgi:hypothetical protein